LSTVGFDFGLLGCFQGGPIPGFDALVFAGSCQ
jgi:hypothetical protein